MVANPEGRCDVKRRITVRAPKSPCRPHAGRCVRAGGSMGGPTRPAPITAVLLAAWVVDGL